MLIKSSVFCHQFNCVVWLDSVACSDKHVAKMYIFWLLAFQCSLFWKRWSHDATLDSEEFLTFISYSTISLLYYVDVILMFIENMLYTLHATYIEHNLYADFSLRLKRLLREFSCNKFTVQEKRDLSLLKFRQFTS